MQLNFLRNFICLPQFPSANFLKKNHCLKGLIFLLSLFYVSCSSSSPEPTQSFVWVNICGRDNGKTLERELIYRIKVPTNWIYQSPASQESLFDSKKALCEFYIDQDIKVVIHNFPAQKFEDRISPHSQIARWKKQFEKVDYTSTNITPQAFGGFSGYLYETTGVLNHQKVTMMAWAMQIAPEHFRQLTSEQMRADYTIKVVGPIEKMQRHSKDIISFARSFELIEEIPS